jgi:hypothetical protein
VVQAAALHQYSPAGNKYRLYESTIWRALGVLEAFSSM